MNVMQKHELIDMGFQRRKKKQTPDEFADAHWRKPRQRIKKRTRTRTQEISDHEAASKWRRTPFPPPISRSDTLDCLRGRNPNPRIADTDTQKAHQHNPANLTLHNINYRTLFHRAGFTRFSDAILVESDNVSYVMLKWAEVTCWVVA